MINRRSTILLIFCCFIFLACVALFFFNGRIIEKKSNCIRILSNENNRLKNDVSYLTFCDSVQISLLNSNFVSKETIVEQPEGEVVRLSDIINGNTVIFKYSKLSCMQCVEEELVLLRQLIKNIGAENIIVITDYDDVSQLYRFQRINHLTGLKFYVSQDGAFEIVDNQYKLPYYLLIEADLEVKYLFLSNKENQQFTLTYFRLISRYFFNKEWQIY